MITPNREESGYKSCASYSNALISNFCNYLRSAAVGKLIGQVVVVTGGNTGIGRAVALAFAREGADVVIAWLDREEETNSIQSEIESFGRRFAAFQTDVSNEASVKDLFEKAENAIGPISILVSNAGIQQAVSIVDLSVDDWDKMMGVHLRGNFLCCREAAKRMIPRGSGRIITVCSQLGYIGRERYTAYSTAKGGVIAFTRALAKELAPHGILVNGVSPGLVDTGFDPLTSEAKAAHAAGLPLKRLGTVDDMTSAFVFLASADSNYFCGQLLHPNGGEIMP